MCVFLLQFRPIMLGEIGTSGNFAAMFMHQFGKAWKLRCNAQVSKLNNELYLTMEPLIM